MKKFFSFLVSWLVGGFVMGLMTPIYNCDSNIFSMYQDEAYWFFVYVASLLLMLVILYFKDLNPRKQYLFQRSAELFAASLMLFMLSWIPAIVLCLFIPGTVLKVVFLVTFALLYFFAHYAFFFRGIVIYARGKIRIFHFTFKTYRTDKIDSATLLREGKGYVLTVTVCGEEHRFKISESAYKMCKKQMDEFLKLVKNMND